MERRATHEHSIAARSEQHFRRSVPGFRRPAIAWRELLVAVVAFVVVLGLAAFAYWWTRGAPLQPRPGRSTPGCTRRMFVNFDHIYGQFANTYYASRLPWILPGRIVYSVLPTDAAYWVLHGLAFVGGVAALFVLVLGTSASLAGVAGAATLALSPMYWNAQYWDYVDGVTLTYLARRPVLRAAADDRPSGGPFHSPLR